MTAVEQDPDEGAHPACLCSSLAEYIPPGLRSHSSGVRRATASKSDMLKSTPASRARASRCSTTLVEPPEATAAAVALANARRVRMPLAAAALSAAMMSSPASCATRGLASSAAGTLLYPSGDSPSTSITIDIVLAVYWPPAPGPGQATRSSSSRSARLIRPAATAPIASNTSPTATDWPRKRPGAIVPL